MEIFPKHNQLNKIGISDKGINMTNIINVSLML